MNELKSRVDNLTHEKRALLAKRLREQRGEAAQAAIPRRPADLQLIPLSPAQERIWFEHQWDSESALYNECVLWRVAGLLETEALHRGIDELVRRHEILRTTFAQVEGRLVQTIGAARRIELPVVDLSEQPESEREGAMRRVAMDQLRRPFELSEGPLLRTLLIRLSPVDHVLVLVVHHIIFDGWSAGVFFGELATLYEAYRRHQPSPLSELPVQYGDYALWQLTAISDTELDRQLSYWKKRLSGCLSVLGLRTDRPRPPVRSVRGARLSFNVDPSTVKSLKELSRLHESTLFMTLISAFTVLLHRYSGDAEILVGTPATNRDRHELSGLIGLFVNTLVLRIEASSRKTFAGLLNEVRQLTIEAFGNKDLPFERLVEELKPERDLSRTPVFQAMFDFQKVASEQFTPDGSGVTQASEGQPAARGESSLRTSFTELDGGTAKFELGLSMRETWSGVSGELEYNTDLFDECTTARLVEHFQNLLEDIGNYPNKTLDDLSLSSESERTRLLREWNQTTLDLADRPATFSELFEQQVERTPQSMAVCAGDRQLTYFELNGLANKLAHFLQSNGIGPESRVGIHLGRSVDAIVAILAILKAGGAYVPLDPAYPVERLRLIIEEASLSVILTAESCRESLSGIGVSIKRVIDLDRDVRVISSMSDRDLDSLATGGNAAYLIFTSGSSGMPCGVVIEHRSLVNLAYGLKESVYSLDQTTPLRVSVNGSLSFDTSIKQIAQLAFGHSLEFVPEDVRWSGEEFLRFLDEREVDVLDITPSQLELLIEAGFLDRASQHPRIVLVGGEAIDRAMWEKLAACGERRFYNLYGPTECTVDTTVCQITSERLTPVTGRPLANVKAFILDESLRPVPQGVAGELYVGGEGVGRGYWNRPDLTALKFVVNPYATIPGDRLYRTGDTVRYLDSGDIEFLGRVDRQIKLRGFRIEPDEIEAALRQHPDVTDAAVTTAPEGGGGLVAYVGARQKCAPSFEGFERHPLPNGLAVVHLNRNETEFLYDEIFNRSAYLKHGVKLPPAGCIFDVGANIGLFTLCAGMQSANSRVFAFEPNPRLFEILKLNVSLYDVNATPFAFGLSSHARSASFTSYPAFSSLSGLYTEMVADKEVVRSFIRHEVASRNGEHGDAHVAKLQDVAETALLEELLEDKFQSETFDVNLRTLSDVIAEYGVEKIDLLKINVEKSELDVLLGMRDVDWPRIEQIVVEVHDIDNRLKTIVGMLERFGFTIRVEQDQRLEQDARTNFYVYAVRHPDTSHQQKLTERFESTVLSAVELRCFLEERLPDFMIPTEFVVLEALPLTPNAKVDHRRLQGLPRALRHGVHRPTARTTTERKLTDIWSAVLKRNEIGIEDSFFHVGGHSLLATQIIARVREAFGINVPLRSFFKTPTIAGLAEEIESKAPSSSASGGLELTPDPEHRFDPFPLTEIQEAYWVGRSDAFALGNVSSHAFLEIENRGLDLDRLNAAWRKLIDRHEMLRAVISTEGRQRILRTVPEYEIRKLDLRGMDTAQQGIELDRVREEMSHQVLPSNEWPLFEIRATLLDGSRMRLHLSLDALIADALSVFRLLAEWRQYYFDVDSVLPPLELSFRDYVLTEERLRETPVYVRDRDYWTSRLETLPQAPDLPITADAQSLSTPRFNRRARQLDKERWAHLTGSAARVGLTPSVVLLTAFSEVLAGWSRTPRFTINLTHFNRLPIHPQVNEIVGDFTSLTLLEVDNSGSESFRERAERLQRQLWNDLDHNHFSGVGVMRLLSQRAQSRQRVLMPIVFTSALALDSMAANETSIDWIGELVYSVGQTPQVWIDHQVFELNSALHINWDVVEDLFPSGMIDRMFAEYVDLLDQLSVSEEAWDRVKPIISKLPEHGLMSSPYAGSGNDRCALSVFSEVIGSLGALERDEFAIPKYRYPSAGSLYPVQAYILIEGDGVEGVTAGYYYCDPLANELVRMKSVERSQSDEENDGEASNDNCLFTIVLVSEENAIKPMYGELARDFGMLEAGYMGRLLTEEAHKHGLVIARAELDIDRVRKELTLGSSQEVLLGLSVCQYHAQ